MMPQGLETAKQLKKTDFMEELGSAVINSAPPPPLLCFCACALTMLCDHQRCTR